MFCLIRWIRLYIGGSDSVWLVYLLVIKREDDVCVFVFVGVGWWWYYCGCVCVDVVWGFGWGFKFRLG